MASNYVLSDQDQAFAQELVASGRYPSVGDVLRESLQLMAEREVLRNWKLEELKKAIQQGLDSGEAEAWESGEDIKAEGRRILADRAKSDAA